MDHRPRVVVCGTCNLIIRTAWSDADANARKPCLLCGPAAWHESVLIVGGLPPGACVLPLPGPVYLMQIGDPNPSGPNFTITTEEA